MITALALLFAFGLAITLTAATSASGSHKIMGRLEASQLPEPAQSSTFSNLAPPRSGANGVPMPDHVVIVMEENHSYSEIIGSPSAPYINALIPQGALFTQSFAITHPSQPNYADLFSGSNQGVTDDSCPHSWTAANLGRALLNASRSFAGYSEDLPFAGYTGCASGRYVRRHAPWINFTNVPTATTRSAFHGLPYQLHDLADTVVRNTKSQRRYARWQHSDGGHLASTASQRVRTVGKNAQQPIRPYFR